MNANGARSDCEAPFSIHELLDMVFEYADVIEVGSVVEASFAAFSILLLVIGCYINQYLLCPIHR